MESIIKKLFLIGSATLAIAVTLTSLPTQAFECTEAQEAAGSCTNDLEQSDKSAFSMDSKFQFTIGSYFALDGVTGDTVTIEALDSITNGAIQANVSSNTPFQIKLSSTQPNLVSGSNSIVASNTLTPGTNSTWGFVSNSQATTDPANYTYQALTSNPATFYRSDAAASFMAVSNKSIPLPFGVAIAPSLPAGTYTTTVTVTLVDNLTE